MSQLTKLREKERKCNKFLFGFPSTFSLVSNPTWSMSLVIFALGPQNTECWTNYSYAEDKMSIPAQLHNVFTFNTVTLKTGPANPEVSHAT